MKATHLLLLISLLPLLLTQDLVAQECGLDSIVVKVSVLTDAYPDEISWSLMGVAETYALVEQNSLLVEDSLYVWINCVPVTDCVVFSIFDRFGDGIIFPGYYSVELDGVEVVNGGGFGGAQITTLICAPGQSCSDGFLAATDTIYQTPYANTYYEFTPDSIGTYKITTCGLNTCDTKIWVYEACPAGSPPDSNEGTIFYDDNEGGCDLQAEVNVLMEMGTIIYIRIGTADGSCMDSIGWQISYEGPITGCTDPNSCNYNALAIVDDGSCLEQGDPDCPAGPDLEVQEAVFRNSLYLDEVDAEPGNCFVNEGCLQGYGQREVIRFDTHFKNIGELDYYIGPEGPDNDQFTYDNCHQHWHYESYAEYLLLDTANNFLPIGHKAGFCVYDLECSDGGTAKYGCNNMGISAGCGDIYESALDCQWVDVTDVADGSYTIVMRVNWLNNPDFNGRIERRIDNNWATACIVLDRSSGSLEMDVVSDCPIYVDCAGEEFGLSELDCAGTCGGTALRGDLDQNALQERLDAETYVTDILGHDIVPNTCNDLNGDNRITVYDAALLNDCVNYENGHIHTGGDAHDHCDFPGGILNFNDTVTLEIIDYNPELQYVDIGMTNPTSRIVAYEFSVGGIMITSVGSLSDLVTEPFTVRGNFSGEIIGLSYPDSSLQKSQEPQPICRIFYQDIVNTEICITSINDIVNHTYEQTIPVIAGACILLTSTKEFSNDLALKVQPNPFSTQTQLVIQYPETIPFDLNIRDLNGRIVQSYGAVYPGIVTIQRGGLPAGIYFFELTNGKVRRLGRVSVF